MTSHAGKNHRGHVKRWIAVILLAGACGPSTCVQSSSTQVQYNPPPPSRDAPYECPQAGEAWPIASMTSLDGQILLGFNSSFSYGPTFNFSADDMGSEWNTLEYIPLANVRRPLQLVPAPLVLADGTTEYPGQFWDTWGFTNPYAQMDTLVGLVGAVLADGTTELRMAAASAKWSNVNLKTSAVAYHYYPEFGPLAALPLPPGPGGVSPDGDGSDGPRAAFDPSTGVVLITSQLNLSNDNPGEVPLHIFAGPHRHCMGNPGSADCPEFDCIDVAPTPRTIGCGTCSANALLSDCSSPGIHCDTSCYIGPGQAHPSHAPVVAFDGGAWVAFMQQNPADKNHPVPTLAMVNTASLMGEEPQQPQVTWYQAPWAAVNPSTTIPTAATPCPSRFDGGTNTQGCIPNCTIGAPAMPIRLIQAPALAYGYDATSGHRLLYLAWNASNEDPSNPIIQIYEATFEIEPSVSGPPSLLLRNVRVPINVKHDEFAPALAAQPTTGDVALFFYSDEDNTDPSLYGNPEAPANACHAHLIGCVSQDGGGPRLNPSSALPPIGDFICNPVDDTSTDIQIEPYAILERVNGHPAGYMADYLGATALVPNHALLVTWVEPYRDSACSGFIGSDGLTDSTGFAERGVVRWVDPPAAPPQSCEDAGDAARQSCLQEALACQGCPEAKCKEEDDCTSEKKDDNECKKDDSCSDDAGEKDDKRCKVDDDDESPCAEAKRACDCQADQVEDRCEAKRALEEAALSKLPAMSNRIEPAASVTLPAVENLPAPPAAGTVSASCATNADCNLPPGAVCQSGICGCSPDRQVCGPPPMLCADLFSDPMHCGGCGVACPSGEACRGGVCAR